MEDQDAKAMDTRRFGVHSNVDLMRNQQTTLSNSILRENAGDRILLESTPAETKKSFPKVIDAKKSFAEAINLSSESQIKL